MLLFCLLVLFLRNIFILSFLAGLGLCYRAGFSLVAVRGLIAVASPIAAHGLWGTQASVAVACGLNSCSSQF